MSKLTKCVSGIATIFGMVAWHVANAQELNPIQQCQQRCAIEYFRLLDDCGYYPPSYQWICRQNYENQYQICLNRCIETGGTNISYRKEIFNKEKYFGDTV